VVERGDKEIHEEKNHLYAVFDKGNLDKRNGYRIVRLKW